MIETPKFKKGDLVRVLPKEGIKPFHCTFPNGKPVKMVTYDNDEWVYIVGTYDEEVRESDIALASEPIASEEETLILVRLYMTAAHANLDPTHQEWHTLYIGTPDRVISDLLDKKLMKVAKGEDIQQSNVRYVSISNYYRLTEWGMWFVINYMETKVLGLPEDEDDE